MEQYGVIGQPVGHSLSPLLHKLIYRQTGYKAEYSRFEVAPASLAGVIPAMGALGIRGVNVTSPYKERMLPYADALSPTAQAVGAVNTLLLRNDGTVFGDNTDGFGITHALLHAGITIRGARFVLCGLSGAGRAVVHALEQGGAGEIVVASTRPEKGVPYQSLRNAPRRDVIINCTPVGMAPNTEESIVDKEILSRFSAAVDLIYNPPETMFLRLAGAGSLQAVNGLWMLIYQGIRSFEVWTGADLTGIDVEALYSALQKYL